MSDESRTLAIAIARITDDGTTYISGEWWTNRFMAVRLPDAEPIPTALSMECECGAPGCGCACDSCLNCEEGTAPCTSLQSCPTAKPYWTTEGHDLERIGSRVTDLITSLSTAEHTPVTVTDRVTSTSFSQRCIRPGEACDGIHAQTRFLAAARRGAQVTEWAVTRQGGTDANATMVLGYRDGELVACLMPFSTREKCKTEAAA